MLVVLLLMLAAVAGPVAYDRLTVERPPEDARADDAPPADDDADAGPALTAIALELSPESRWAERVGRLAAARAQAVCLTVPVWQEHAESSSVFWSLRRSPTAEGVIELSAAARRAGLKVVLMPVLRLDEPESGQWAGRLKPRQAWAWWEDYGNIVAELAKAAAAGEADILCVGYGLGSLEGRQTRWATLIERTRRHFDGPLAYVAEPGTGGEVEFWSQLDWAGLADAVGGEDAAASLGEVLAGRSAGSPGVAELRRRSRRPVLRVVFAPIDAIDALPAAAPADSAPTSPAETPYDRQGEPARR
jgi:hypothetical protein